MAFMAFLLLITALVLFIVSTNQWALPLRGAVWAGGLLSVILGWIVLGTTHRDFKLAAAIGDFLSKLSHPGDSMLARMYAANSGQVGNMIFSLFDIFQIFALVVGIIALIAFTPGERLERILRPVMMGMIGAVFGGVIALAVVGTGFGQRPERSSYAQAARLDTAADGATVLVNDKLLKLRGIAAPEAGQVCRRGGAVFDCSSESRAALAKIIEGAFLMCVPDKAAETAGAPTGRANPIVTCTGVKGDNDSFSVAQRLVEDGYAFDTTGAFRESSYKASALGKGLYAFCMVSPDAWAKLSAKDRAAFRNTGVLPAKTTTIGNCPVVKKPGKPTVDSRVVLPGRE